VELEGRAMTGERERKRGVAMTESPLSDGNRRVAKDSIDPLANRAAATMLDVCMEQH